MIRTIIVEDERSSLNVLKRDIEEYFSEIEILATCLTLDEAKRAIIKYKPDLIFMDIEMDGQDSFSLLSKLKGMKSKVVFTTGHSKYAAKSYRFDALDFLVKPIQIEELQEAIEKYKNAQTGLASEYGSPDQQDFIQLTSDRETKIIRKSDIVFCEAEGSYTKFYLINRSKPLISSKNLKNYLSLTQNRFFKVNRSFIVNIDYIDSISSERIVEFKKEVPFDTYISVAKKELQRLRNLYSID
jgi:two-component system LytT family response regulator